MSVNNFWLGRLCLCKVIEEHKFKTMSSVQGAMRELRILKQEEATLINLASKISDQLNRLKVEELALQNHVRLQNEELERKSRGSQRSINRSLPVEEFEDEDSNGVEYEDEELEMGDNSGQLQKGVVPLNLVVNNYHQHSEIEEEEDDDDDTVNENTRSELPADTADHEDIESFVNSL